MNPCHTGKAARVCAACADHEPTQLRPKAPAAKPIERNRRRTVKR